MDSHRSPKKNRDIAKSVEVMVRKKIDEALIGRPINNKAMRSFLCVMCGKKQNRFAEIRVAKGRMRHQKLPRQIRNITTRWSHTQNLGSDHLLFKNGVIYCPEVPKHA